MASRFQGIIVAVVLFVCPCLTLAASGANRDTATSSPVKTYHDGSIRDLNAIGNRNVGCRTGFGNWYSVERQISMGKQYSQ